LEEDGGTILLKPGDRFLLRLGQEYDWTVNVADPSIVSRVVDVTVVQGAQGLYEAHKAGTASLSATGDPVCRQAQPPCAAPSRSFKIDIVVN
jgi:hypothetical protein